MGDLIVTGTNSAMESLLQKLKDGYKISVGMGDQVSFLKRILGKDKNTTTIQVSSKYLDGLVENLLAMELGADAGCVEFV